MHRLFVVIAVVAKSTLLSQKNIFLFEIYDFKKKNKKIF
jgi:hypothetical protein